jgi:hypothetical protein
VDRLTRLTLSAPDAISPAELKELADDAVSDAMLAELAGAVDSPDMSFDLVHRQLLAFLQIERALAAGFASAVIYQDDIIQSMLEAAKESRH